MRNIKYLLIISTLLLTLFSCGGKKGDESSRSLSLGYWGQLAELESLTPNSMFLIFLKPTETYDVCVADHLIKDFPQFIKQLDASIKIWGKYINRDIKTNFTTFEMEAPSLTETQDQSFDKYTNECSNADIAVGYANTDALGVAASKYATYQRPDGMQMVQSARKAVLVQNPIYKNKKWVGLFKEADPAATVDEIIETLLQRDQQLFLLEENELSLVTVLIHEFGHVWGLCDMYALSQGKTNCDPVWSKKDNNGKLILNPDAIMAKAHWKNPLFLQDDDIEGIRTLAKRDRFESNWKNQKSFDEVQPAIFKDFFFQQKNSELVNDTLAFTFALYNESAISLEIAMMTDLGPLNYQPLKIAEKIDTPNYTLNLGMPANVNVQRLQIIIKDENGTELAVHQEIFEQ